MQASWQPATTFLTRTNQELPAAGVGQHTAMTWFYIYLKLDTKTSLPSGFHAINDDSNIIQPDADQS